MRYLPKLSLPAHHVLFDRAGKEMSLLEDTPTAQ